MFISRCAKTGKVYTTRPPDSLSTTEAKIKKLYQAHLQAKNSPISYRINQMNTLKHFLGKKKNALIDAIHFNMGKSLVESQAEVDKAIHHCDYYIHNAEDFLRPSNTSIGGYNYKTTLEPTGVIFKIIPLNFPVWIGFKTLVPNVILGNTVLLRPSMKCLAVDIVLEELLRESELDCYGIAFTDIKDTESIIKNEYISGVSFTGTTAAGRVIGDIAGKCLKRCVLELGGSDAFVITENVNIDKVVEDAIKCKLKSKIN